MNQEACPEVDQPHPVGRRVLADRGTNIGEKSAHQEHDPAIH